MPAKVNPGWLSGISVLVGAFLLFQVQPIAAKALLPSFGGSPGVWTTCMLFFQTALVGGYAYAHLTSRLLDSRRQSLLHAGLLLAATVVVQVVPPVAHGETLNPTQDILGLLALNIGPAFLLLSATAPLVQRWYLESTGRTPYRLYALSNAGSLVGLLSYPLVVEPNLAVWDQSRLWTVALLVLVGLLAVQAWWMHRGAGDGPQFAIESATGASTGTSVFSWLSWFALAAIPCALFLGATTTISTQIAPFPLLWVVPLALYLTTLIICFDHPRWYRPRLMYAGLVLSIAMVGLLARQLGPTLGVLGGWLLAATFFGCMVCHGMLARLKPAPQMLTTYYLAVAMGGACGGIFVGVVAPRIFAEYHEFPLGLAASVLVGGSVAWPIDSPAADWKKRLCVTGIWALGAFAVLVWSSPELAAAFDRLARFFIGTSRPETTVAVWTVIIAAVAVPTAIWQLGSLVKTSPARWQVAAAAMAVVSTLIVAANLAVSWWAGRVWREELLAMHDYLPLLVNPFGAWLLGSLAIRFANEYGARDRPTWHRLLAACAFGAALIGLAGGAAQLPTRGSRQIAARRNFFGLLRVSEVDFLTGPMRSFAHGNVAHGAQLMISGGERTPTTYFTRNSGIGRLLASFPDERPIRLGVVGLGAGTLAAYGEPGDLLRFYEIDTDVVEYANRYFDFLSQCPANVSVVTGDGRLSLDQETPQNFDVLVLDAFAGGAVPCYLLTREAVETYLGHVGPRGVLAFNISNSHVDLAPVIRGHAEHFGLTVGVVDHDDDAVLTYPTSWAFLTRDKLPLDLPEDPPWFRAEQPSVQWTDAFHGIVQLLH